VRPSAARSNPAAEATGRGATRADDPEQPAIEIEDLKPVVAQVADDDDLHPIARHTTRPVELGAPAAVPAEAHLEGQIRRTQPNHAVIPCVRDEEMRPCQRRAARPAQPPAALGERRAAAEAPRLHAAGVALHDEEPLALRVAHQAGRPLKLTGLVPLPPEPSRQHCGT